MSPNTYDDTGIGRWLIGGAVVVLCIFLLIWIIDLASSTSTPQGGEVGVVRNGSSAWPLDWFDNHKVRGFVDNGSGTTWVGLGSTVHYYPADFQQRFFRMCSEPNGATCPGADAPAVTVPSADGVEMTIDGTIYLNTTFNNSPSGHSDLAAFDNQFATRTFGTDNKHAYDGNDGWSDFLGAIVLPIVVNNERETLAGFRCAQLVSSCALVQNQGSSKTNIAKLVNGKNNQANVIAVQNAVGNGLGSDLQQTLKHQYFGHLNFKLQQVTLPLKVQNAIDDAQSAFAQISQAQARVQSATADAAANKARQKGYNACHTCGEIDALKALPRGLQALGGNVALGITTGK